MATCGLGICGLGLGLGSGDRGLGIDLGLGNCGHGLVFHSCGLVNITDCSLFLARVGL